MLTRIKKGIIGLLIGVSLLGSCRATSQTRFHGTADATYSSRYVAKDGSILSERAVVQQHVNMGLERLALDLWGNYDLGSKELNELDITLDYTQPVSDKVNLSVGYTYFHYPTGFMNETQEIYAGIGYSGLFNASIFAFHDFVDGKGTLILPKLGKEFKYNKIGIYPNLTLGYNSGYFQDDSRFSHLKLGVDLNIPIGSGWSLMPFLNHQFGLNENFKDITYGGLGIKKEF